MPVLVLLRHGESLWNRLNLFIGWIDVPLSERGIQEALKAGKLLRKWRFDIIFTSDLVRAIQTAMLAMAESEGVPMILHEGRMGEWGRIYGKTERISYP